MVCKNIHDPPATSADVPAFQTTTALPTAFDRLVDRTDLSKSDMNNLIMEYLITEGYPSAAEKFAREANIEQQPDHNSIQQRVNIRESIHRGDLQQAIDLINDLEPELLDNDKKLHFSLLRLQLVELIRASFATTDTTAVAKAIEFAKENLAPYATENPFKNDLERAMALLIVPREAWSTQAPLQSSSAASASTSSQSTQNQFGALYELVDPSLRRKVARDVNEAILQSQDSEREAQIRELARTRAWAEQQARDTKADVPAHISLGLRGEDDADNDEAANASSNGQDAKLAGNGAG
ncbi:hypothetical protein DV736_g4917, partial [Chaetothyriales sp. CBS 134916]